MKKVYTKIESIVGNVITVRAEGVKYNDLAMVGDSYANVIKLDGDLVSLQVFAGAQGVRTNDPVRFLGVPIRVIYSENLLVRVFDGSGKPRDNGPELDENMVEIGGPSVNPAKRIVPKNLIRTGIPMIDVFNTLVESQKLPIFSVSGEPYNELLARIAMQAEVDLIILGGMGLKYTKKIISGFFLFVDIRNIQPFVMDDCLINRILKRKFHPYSLQLFFIL